MKYIKSLQLASVAVVTGYYETLNSKLSEIPLFKDQTHF